jgi:hypothetical protein
MNATLFVVESCHRSNDGAEPLPASQDLSAPPAAGGAQEVAEGEISTLTDDAGVPRGGVAIDRRLAR